MRYRIVPETLQEAETAAAQDYAKHVVLSEGAGRWLFTRPDSGMFRSYVIESPGAVIVYGDGEDLIICPHERDALRWLRDCLIPPKDTDYAYICEKIRSGLEPQFSQALLDAHIKTLEAERDESAAAHGEDGEESEYADAIDTALVLLEGMEMPSEEAAYAILSGIGDGCDLPCLREVPYGVLHELAGLRIFFEKMGAP